MQFDINGLVGKTEEEVAKALENTTFFYRVVKEDGVAFCGLCDFNMLRVNLVIENKIVTEVNLG